MPCTTKAFWKEPIGTSEETSSSEYDDSVIKILSCLLHIFIETCREEEADGRANQKDACNAAVEDGVTAEIPRPLFEGVSCNGHSQNYRDCIRYRVSNCRDLGYRRKCLIAY